MKPALFALAIFFSNFCFSQTNTFIRIYDLGNHKIAKGHFQDITNTSITIAKPSKTD